MTRYAPAATDYRAVLFSDADCVVPRWNGARRLAAACVVAASLYALAVGYLWVGQSRFVYMTSRTRFAEAPDPSLFRAGYLRTPDGLALRRLALVHDARPDRYWMVFCMPAGGSIGMPHIQNQLRTLWSFGYNVVAFDYRGFGENAGIPTEPGLYLDAATAYAYVTRELGVPADRVILAGRSLGSAVAAELATHEAAAGVVLFSPLDSVPRLGSRLYPWAPVRRLATASFDTVARAPHITVPVLLVYGTRDDFLPRSVAVSLIGAFAGPKAMIETAGGHQFSGFDYPGYDDTRALSRALDRFWPVSVRSSNQP